MKINEFKCKKCDSNNVYIEMSGNNTGLYCKECGSWIKWLNKNEVRLAKKLINDTNEKDDELIFLGMNVVEKVLDKMLRTKKRATAGMSKTELQAYELGISNTLAILQVLLTETEHVVVNTFGSPTEYTYDELVKHFRRLEYNTNN